MTTARGLGRSTFIYLFKAAARHESLSEPVKKWDAAEVAKSHGSGIVRKESPVVHYLKHSVYCENLAFSPDHFQEQAYACYCAHLLRSQRDVEPVEKTKGKGKSPSADIMAGLMTVASSFSSSSSSAKKPKKIPDSQLLARSKAMVTKMDQITAAPAADLPLPPQVVVSAELARMESQFMTGETALSVFQKPDTLQWYMDRWFAVDRETLGRTWGLDDSELGAAADEEAEKKKGKVSRSKKKKAGDEKDTEEEAGQDSAKKGSKRKRESNRLTEEAEASVLGHLTPDFGTLDQAKLDQIRRSPVAQVPALVSKHMQFAHEAGLWKGPIPLLADCKTQVQRLRLLALRYRIFRLLNCRTPSMSYAKEAAHPHMVWLRTSNIAPFKREEWKMVASKPNRISPYPVQVLDRGSMGIRLGSELTAEDFKKNPELIVDIIRMLVARFIAKPPVGDTQMRNVLVARCEDNQELYAFNTDYEDNRSGFEEEQVGSELQEEGPKRKRAKVNAEEKAEKKQTKKKKKKKSGTFNEDGSESWQSLLFTKAPALALLVDMEHAARASTEQVETMLVEVVELCDTPDLEPLVSATRLQKCNHAIRMMLSAASEQAKGADNSNAAKEQVDGEEEKDGEKSKAAHAAAVVEEDAKSEDASEEEGAAEEEEEEVGDDEEEEEEEVAKPPKKKSKHKPKPVSKGKAKDSGKTKNKKKSQEMEALAQHLMSDT